ncbi:type II secretion system F family protein [Patescibacteria group bacterium]|nr:MAG: type II secretion system F family protein [Patescibacteria group bacterium]
MALYDFTAKTREGREASGVVVADTEELAEDVLRERGMMTATLLERPRPGVLALSFEIFSRVSAKDLVALLRQLSVMSVAGVTLHKALRTLSEHTGNQRLAEILREVTENVEGGSRFSDALAAHPAVFSNFTVNMIRSGETTGRLAEVLDYLADQSEKDYDLRSKIRGAMMYPAFVISGLVVVGFIMMTFVVPKLTDVLKESGAELPVTTKALIAVSGFFAAYWYLLIVAAAGLAVGLRFYIKTEDGRRLWDGLKIRLPIFGKLFREIYVVRFTQSLETLLAGGVDQVTALASSADIVSNAIYRDLILQTRREVEDGNSITTVFAGNPAMPSMVTELLAVGEDTGQLRETLKRLTDFYTREITNSVAALVTLIEPLIVVTMGIAVGVMVSAIILPMYSLANSF